MNAVEIEEAVSALVTAPFDAAEFPFQLLAAFGNKETTVKRLRGGANASDVPHGVLQRNNIHLATCAPGEVGATLTALRESPKTGSAKVKFVLATDGAEIEAEEIATGEALACAYGDLDKHFGFLLPLAGISTVREIKNNPIDIKATGRLNKLYIELLKTNPDWESEARRHELNQFMARLIFCFFAEDTGIFLPDLFTACIRQFTDAQSTNTHEVIAELFRVMDTRPEQREGKDFHAFAEQFPYVNGGLFTETIDCPRFSRIARAYLLRAGELDWKEINPDIFGSMIQAVADDDERGSLGMHYTSVPNILKVLNPLFLDDLREQLAAAGDNARKLKNLRRRIANIRVFDPACGSGNFLVIAYIRMREIEWEIIQRLGDLNSQTEIRLENFYGIEIKSFPVEIAKLSLLIAEFQCNVRFYGEQVAWMNVLPLHRTGQIHVGNALRMDWFEVCPSSTKEVKEQWDLGGPTGEFALEPNNLCKSNLPETYICGNPPYVGSARQSSNQKADVEFVFASHTKTWRSLDYVACWFKKAADFSAVGKASFAFVSTKSVCQGEQVPILWPLIYANALDIQFAYMSFKWANLASQNAGVTVVIVGIGTDDDGVQKRLFAVDDTHIQMVRRVNAINAYLIPSSRIIVNPTLERNDDRGFMIRGNMPTDGGNLLLDAEQRKSILLDAPQVGKLLRPFVGAQELINAQQRYCVWIDDANLDLANSCTEIVNRIEGVRKMRLESSAASTREYAAWPHKFRQIQGLASKTNIVVPRVSSENRDYLPAALYRSDTIPGDRNFVICDAPLWNMALIVSRLHWVWIGAVCVRMRTDFSYSNTLGWNTFPVPTLTNSNKADLTRCAENILVARENHFPATIADLYDPDNMPGDLRRAHEENDETLERIYIGRRFKNDTERLEKLFDMYSKMIEAEKAATPAKAKAKKPKAVS